MIRVLCSLALVLFSWTARPDNIRGICRHEFEGTYLGTLGPDQVRVNLICLTDDDLSATVCPAIDKEGHFSIDLVTSLSHAEIDGNRLIIANFELNHDSRSSGSSKSIVSYLTLDVPSLLSGQLKGRYLSGAMTEFRTLEAKRIETYPTMTPIAKTPLAADAVGGVFRTDMPEDRDGMNLIFNNILNTPVISIVGVYSHFINHFTEGPYWDTSGIFTSVTPEGNGGEPDDKKMNFIRGHFSDQDHLEFYLINSVLGLRGPFHGVRIENSLGPNP